MPGKTLNEKYAVQCSDDEYDLARLTFYESGDYQIQYTLYSDECEVFVWIFSSGTYKVRNDTILAHDIDNSFDMSFIRDEDTLEVISGLKFLAEFGGAKLVDTGRYDSLNTAFFEDLRYRLEMDTDAFLNDDAGRYKISSGAYLRDDISSSNYDEAEKGFWLELNSDSTFCYSYEYIPLCAGKWSRKGNLIDLHDALMDVSFYLGVIDNNTLQSSFLPSAFVKHQFFLVKNPVNEYKN